jgi:flavin-dependent dehydrogenase
MATMKCDVAIIGGGPAGSTVGTLLKKYRPDLDVVILEREKFPRDHVGESLLPLLMRVLNEMGVWEKVEAAGFPIKLGAAYRWGRAEDQELYYFNFLPDGQTFQDQPRPGRYEGQRADTAFQVDRSIYDEILLDHARAMGCRVYEETSVSGIVRSGGNIERLAVKGPFEELEAKYYVDASGSESLVRRAMEVGTEQPAVLRNIAIWDYWENAEWAEKIGVGGTYVYVLSLGWGWIWFIPIGPTRTSIGLVLPAQYYKDSGKSAEALYLEALAQQPLVTQLTANGKREGPVQATKDWNFVSERLYGENWFLAGDAAGFADPILAAGLTLAQHGARRVAYSILELERGELDPGWIKDQYQALQRKNTWNHIRFAEYWYSVNSHFTDLKEYCTEIAKDSGLSLSPDEAFQWLGTGGFADEVAGLAFSATFEVKSIKGFLSRFGGEPATWSVRSKNVFHLKAEGAAEETQANYLMGRIYPVPTLKRGSNTLPLVGTYRYVYNALKRDSEIQPLAERFLYEAGRDGRAPSEDVAMKCMETLEALVSEGWVEAAFDPSLPLLES